MKHLLLTTIAAVLVVGCGPSVDIHEAAATGNIEAVKQYIAAGTEFSMASFRVLDLVFWIQCTFSPFIKNDPQLLKIRDSVSPEF